MSEPLEKAKAALAAAKDLINTTELDHKGLLPLQADLDIARLISVAGVQASIAQAEALEGILRCLDGTQARLADQLGPA